MFFWLLHPCWSCFITTSLPSSKCMFFFWLIVWIPVIIPSVFCVIFHVIEPWFQRQLPSQLQSNLRAKHQAKWQENEWLQDLWHKKTTTRTLQTTSKMSTNTTFNPPTPGEIVLQLLQSSSTCLSFVYFRFP